MSPQELTLRIRRYLYQLAPDQAIAAKDVAAIHGISTPEALACLIRLLDIGAATKLEIHKTVYWHKGAPFVARRIVPLFAGTPEWVVESGEGNHIGWFPREFLARMVAAALSGE